MENITIYTYVDELLINDGGRFDRLGHAWFTVPMEWLEVQVSNAGYMSMREFLESYNYDVTVGWIGAAIEDGVLLGVGTGVCKNNVSDENDSWENENAYNKKF